MPLYDYKCTQCGALTEVRHGFDEAFAERCAACGSELRRVFNPAPILFKGSGFYVTDSRKAPASEASAGGGSAPAPGTAAAPPAPAAPAAPAPATSPSSSKESAA